VQNKLSDRYLTSNGSMAHIVIDMAPRWFFTS
jgi:hypothetical protein